MSGRPAPQAQRPIDDDSDVEEEALANDYREQVGYEDGQEYDLDRTSSLGGAQDLQAQLAAAATPLEYGASIELKTQSYDSYCNLFHYILNSEGPVDIEVPSVRPTELRI
jgi:translation initiation factor 3 subunit L